MASIIVIAVVLVLDVLAFVLAIGAERRRSYANVTAADSSGRAYCVYSSDASTAYGVSALLLLLAAQAVAMAATRCFCCGRGLSPGRWRAWSGTCFIICCAAQGDVRDRGAVPAGGVGPERLPHQVRLAVQQRPAPVRRAAEGSLRRRRRLRLPHRAPGRAALPLLRQGARRRRRAPAHRRRHRHDPHVM
ncbi:fiber protein Fb34 isoform X1 [Zea mays]|uniref:Fiber protein Fb34 n=1 Tax=Zea mays TaxID=4577 RepID=A0A804RMA0_MAIZE|nr:fiber protein Fb34 isoform X1 [Zea mays]